MTAEIEASYVAELKSIQEEVIKLGTVHSRKHLRSTTAYTLSWHYVSQVIQLAQKNMLEVCILS